MPENSGVTPSELAPFAGDGEQRAGEDDAEFVAGVPAQHPFAVHYQGSWETPWDGTSVAVRRHARALALTGLPVLLESFHRIQINREGFAEPAHGNLDDGVIAEVGHLVTTSASALVPRVKHLVVRDAEHLRLSIMPRSLGPDTVADPARMLELRDSIYATTVAFTVWERDRIDPSVARQLTRCAQAWVPCTRNARMLVDCGVPEDQVRVVPHPYDPDDDICKLTRRRPTAERRFYSLSGAWQPRKGYHKLLGAFLRAFCPRDRVHLTIKYAPSQWQGYAQPRDCLGRWLADGQVRRNGWTWETLVGRLEMIEGRVDPDKLLKLHFDNNIYVCSSHGEAWCLPAYDAKCAGNRLVHVPYGGTEDFAEPGRGDLEVPFRLAPVHASYGWPEDCQWADYDVDALAVALQHAHAPEEYVRSARFSETFSLQAVGKQMRALLLDTLDSVPKARAYLEACSAS